jgi:hypothetical protein
MNKPNLLALTKPEEGVRSPELVDDSKLLGILNAISRLQVGEMDSETLADTLDTFASIIRQLMWGENPTGSYLKYPVKSIEQIVADIDALTASTEKNDNIIQLTASEAIPQFSMIKLTGNDLMGLAVASTSANSKTIGCMVSTAKSTGEVGDVAVSGQKVEGILSGATFGDKYYLDTVNPGLITTTIPLTGVQLEVGAALNETDILLDIKIPFIKNA